MHTPYAEYSINIIRPGEWHKEAADITLLYVVDGRAELLRQQLAREGQHAGGQSLTLQRQGLAILNRGEQAQLSLPKTALACRLDIDYFGLTSSAGYSSLLFDLSLVPPSDGRYRRLQWLAQRLLLSHLSESSGTYEELGYYCLLCDALVRDFRIQDQASLGRDKNNRLQEILSYLYQNSSGRIRLEEIADRLYMSPSAVSRLFYRETGEHLKAYVNRLRLERVAAELAEDESKSVARIASDNGFSTLSTLNREFRKHYNMTPSAYRALQQDGKRREDPAGESAAGSQVIPDVPDPASSQAKVVQILKTDLSERPPHPARSVQADIRSSCHWKKWENTILNVGSIHAMENAALRSQVAWLQEAMNPTYLRFWSIFDRTLMMQSGDERASKMSGGSGKEMNFGRLDEVLDFCVEHHMRLFLDMAPRRNRTRASENTVLFDIDTNITFESEWQWMNAVDTLFRHLVGRYTLQVVAGWVFEFSFFLNDTPYYADPHYRPKRVWDLGSMLVRRDIPGALVAGPGLIGSKDEELQQMLLEQFLDEEHMPDIFTAMLFPYVFQDPTQASKRGDVAGYQRVNGDYFFAAQLEPIQKCLAGKNFHGQLFITDWGYTLSNRNYIQDSCFRASFLVRTGLWFCQQVDGMGIFFASDLINVFSDTSSILAGSGGIVTRNGIRKPAYYAFDFMKELDSFLVYMNQNVIITCDQHDEIRILCNDAADPEQQDLYQNMVASRGSTIADPSILYHTLSSMEPMELELTLMTGEDTDTEVTYKIHQQILNETTGSVFGQWNALGCEKDLSRADIDYVRKTCVPQVRIGRTTAREGTLSLKIRMQPNEIRLITLTRVRK